MFDPETCLKEIAVESKKCYARNESIKFEFCFLQNFGVCINNNLGTRIISVDARIRKETHKNSHKFVIDLLNHDFIMQTNNCKRSLK